MRKVLLLFCIICMLGLAGCQKEEAQGDYESDQPGKQYKRRMVAETK